MRVGWDPGNVTEIGGAGRRRGCVSGGVDDLEGSPRGRAGKHGRIFVLLICDQYDRDISTVLRGLESRLNMWLNATLFPSSIAFSWFRNLFCAFRAHLALILTGLITPLFVGGGIMMRGISCKL